MTPEQFKKARHELGLTLSELANILNVDGRTVRKWEAPADTNSARPPNPIAVRVMRWLVDGFRPPQWPR